MALKRQEVEGLTDSGSDAGEFAKRGVKVLALSSNDSESHKG